MKVIDEIFKYRLIAMTFEELTWTHTISHLIASNDGINWVDIKKYDFGWRDASIQYREGWFYIIYTGGIVRTNDFEIFEDLGWPINADGLRTWAPEWFIDSDGSWKIIYTQTTNGIEESSFKAYWCDYDPDSNTVSNLLTPINVKLTSKACIDLNMTLINGEYYLWLRDDDRIIRLYSSKLFDGEYKLIETNFPDVQREYMDEGPEMVVLDNQTILLYSDPWQGSMDRSLRYSLCIDGDITQWSNMNSLKGLDFSPRHFGVYDFGMDGIYKYIYIMNSIIQKVNTIYEQLNIFGYIDKSYIQKGVSINLDTQNYDPQFRNLVIDYVNTSFKTVNGLIGLLKSKKISDLSGDFVKKVQYLSLDNELNLETFKQRLDLNLNGLSESLIELEQLLEIYGIGENNGNN